MFFNFLYSLPKFVEFQNVVILGSGKGQLISKAIYGLLASTKKRTDKFVLFVFLLFTGNKSNSSVGFLG